jgi:hypothetical protein
VDEVNLIRNMEEGGGIAAGQGNSFGDRAADDLCAVFWATAGGDRGCPDIRAAIPIRSRNDIEKGAESPHCDPD